MSSIFSTILGPELPLDYVSIDGQPRAPFTGARHPEISPTLSSGSEPSTESKHDKTSRQASQFLWARHLYKDPTTSKVAQEWAEETGATKENAKKVRDQALIFVIRKKIDTGNCPQALRCITRISDRFTKIRYLQLFERHAFLKGYHKSSFKSSLLLSELGQKCHAPRPIKALIDKGTDILEIESLFKFVSTDTQRQKLLVSISPSLKYTHEFEILLSTLPETMHEETRALAPPLADIL